MNYNRILITPLLSVPSDVVLVANGEKGTVTITAHGVQVTTVGGEVAAALVAFMNGEVDFPVKGGVLNIPQGWAYRQRAQGLGMPAGMPQVQEESTAKVYLPQAMDNRLYGESTGAPNDVPAHIRALVNDPVPPPKAVSEDPTGVTIDFDAVARRLAGK